MFRPLLVWLDCMLAHISEMQIERLL
jgi:hypothetical protein